MKLESLAYAEHQDDPAYWEFKDVTLGDVNLVVGINASGKTRTLNVIGGLASLLSGKQKQLFQSGSYFARFASARRSRPGEMEYAIHIADGEVLTETLADRAEEYLRRTKSGRGHIWAEKENKYIDFKVPRNQLAAVAKRDELQHSVLEFLYGWASSVTHLRWGTLMGKDKVIVVGKGGSIKGKFAPNVTSAIETFLSGCNQFGNRVFKTPIRRDMKAIGFPIKDISAGPSSSISLSPSVGEAVVLNVQEADLKCQTDQGSISDGMFRALALLIQVNYAILADPSSCILVDDIGEGLDYERANALVRVIRDKAIGNPVQLIMATNNRFVMNSIPLKEWQVIERKGHRVRFYNYDNSKDAFDEFEYTGLSNFDFFRSGFFAQEDADYAQAGNLRRGTD